MASWASSRVVCGWTFAGTFRISDCSRGRRTGRCSGSQDVYAYVSSSIARSARWRINAGICCSILTNCNGLRTCNAISPARCTSRRQSRLAILRCVATIRDIASIAFGNCWKKASGCSLRSWSSSVTFQPRPSRRNNSALVRSIA